jgi:hypothetical protein
MLNAAHVDAVTDLWTRQVAAGGAVAELGWRVYFWLGSGGVGGGAMGEYGWLGRANGVQLGGFYRYKECLPYNYSPEYLQFSGKSF